jgi:DNA-directed RNA polymerase specialized sigma24 family protein
MNQNASWLSYIAKHHKEWVKLVRSWGCNDYAEDIVQEMYIRCLTYTTKEKIVKNEQVNKGYIYFTLRSIFISYKKQCSKLTKVTIDEMFDFPFIDEIHSEQAYGQILNKVDEEKRSWHWYDVKLFDLYLTSGMSMRQIEAETNISLTSVFHTIKNCKARINNAVGEDIEDYFNNDYELI